MDAIEKDLLLQIADLHGVPEGAYNIRANGGLQGRASTENIEIVPKADGKDGIDIFIKPGTKNESLHIPVIISKAGLQECVYNDFYIGQDADVVIVAGCGIHNCGGVELTSRHDGIHTFHVGKNAKVNEEYLSCMQRYVHVTNKAAKRRRRRQNAKLAKQGN